VRESPVPGASRPSPVRESPIPGARVARSRCASRPFLVRESPVPRARVAILGWGESPVARPHPAGRLTKAPGAVPGFLPVGGPTAPEAGGRSRNRAFRAPPRDRPRTMAAITCPWSPVGHAATGQAGSERSRHRVASPGTDAYLAGAGAGGTLAAWRPRRSPPRTRRLLIEETRGQNGDSPTRRRLAHPNRATRAPAAGRDQSSPGASARVVRTSAPYFASLFSPTPLIVPSSARLAGDRVAISRSVASWKIT
jgi:hypothetical protein